LDDSTFYSEIERCDAEFSAVPLELRQLDIYHCLIGSEERNESTLSYLSKISAWFQQKYGAAAAWDGVIGRQPILRKGRLLVLQIRHPEVNPKSGVSDLLEELRHQGPDLSPEEHRNVAITHLESSADFSALHNMEMRPSLFTKEQRGLSRRAWFDLRNAVSVLESSGDVQGSIVHAHEAAEKFLKIALIHEGCAYSKLGRGDLKHDLNSLIKSLFHKQAKYRFLKRTARDLEELFGSMTIQRYESVNRSLSDAIDAFRLARHCCGFVAMQVELDDERGAPDITFRPGRYYQDYSGRQYRFCGFEKGAQGETLCNLFLLELSDQVQTIDLLGKFKAPCSFHYKEIRDQAAISRLEKRYSSIRRRANSQIDMDRPTGTTIERIDESFDAMLSIKMPVGRKR
jgi:HEPN domain-containing protein